MDIFYENHEGHFCLCTQGMKRFQENEGRFVMLRLAREGI
jgi:hypothetical protein